MSLGNITLENLLSLLRTKVLFRGDPPTAHRHPASDIIGLANSGAATPLPHASSHNAGGSDAMAIDAAAGTGSLRTLGTGGTSACAGNDARLVQAIDSHLRAFHNPYAIGTGTGTLAPASGTAYFCFVGRTTVPMTPKYVEIQLTAAGTGAQTAEIGLFSTSSPPNKSGLSFTKIEATGTVDALTGGTSRMVRNTNAFTTLIPAGTYLWAGMRTAMATTQPTLHALSRDHNIGSIQSTAASGALTGAGPWTGAIPSAAVGGQQGLDLTVTLD